MDSWDDDDFDPSDIVASRVADAMATFGLDEKLKKEPEPPKEPEKKAVTKSKGTASNNVQHREMTQAEILELQKRGDMELFTDLLGMEKQEKGFGELSTKLEFNEYAKKAADAFAARAQEQFYSDFVYTLVENLSTSLNKFQLENVARMVNEKVKVLQDKEAQLKAEQEAEKAAQQQKKPQQKKKQIKEEVFEDYVEDEYDDYIDKY